METYLMMLYVTLDQESALKTFFEDKGWSFCKPDLSMTTDKLGPPVRNAPKISTDAKFSQSIIMTGKRKASSPSRNAPKIKLVKIVSSAKDVDSKTAKASKRSKEIEKKELNHSEDTSTEMFGNIVLAPDDDEEMTDMIVKMKNRKRNIKGTDKLVESIGDTEPGEERVEQADSYEEGNDDTDDSVEELNDEEKLDGSNVGMELEIQDKDSGKLCSVKNVSARKIKDETMESPNHEEEISMLQSGNITYFTCEICGRRYLSKPTLQRHKRKHSCPFYCSSCSMAFYSAEDLSQHNQEKHTHQFSCPTCDKIFKRKNSLSVHIESVHKDVQRFPCTWPDCKRSFFRQDVLNDHLNTHTGARPYTCQKCFKTYSSKSCLNHHWRACKSDGLVCNICGQVLSSRSGLNDHIQGMHDKKPLPCVCGQVFTWRNNLLKHKKNCFVFFSSKNNSD